MRQSDLRLGEMLIEQKIITLDQLEEALKDQSKTGELIGNVFIRLQFATEEQILQVLSEKLGVQYVKIKGLELKSEVITKVSAKFACYYKIVPLSYKDNVLDLAVTNPLDLAILDDIKLVLKLDINPVLAGERDILESIKKYYGVGAETVEKIIGQTPTEGAMPKQLNETSSVDDMADDASIIKFVNQVLQQAVSERATDIHIEPFEGELRIRYRVDGVLFNASIPPSIKYLHSAIVSRVKIMSALNIAEKRLPQDGRIKLKVGQSDLDLRVSVIPTSFGESVHIRILSANILLGLGSAFVSTRKRKK